VVVQKVGEWNQLFAFRLADRRLRQITASPSDKNDSAWSPDGSWIAFCESVGGTYTLSRIPVAGGASTVLASSAERLRHVFMSRDPRWVYYQPSHRNIWRVPAEGGAPQQVTHFPESALFIEEPTIAPDGSYLAYCKSNGGASLWLLSLDDPEAR
jgi:Tol biopolymer transport system component